MPGRPSSTPRVKVVDPNDATRRAATYSVCGALLMAALAYYAWQYWREDSAPSFAARPLDETDVRWRCPNGHDFEATAIPGPHPCPTCGAEAAVLQIYKCANHGAIPVLGIFGRDATGRLSIQRVRVGDAPWQPAARTYICPACGEPLLWWRDPAPSDQ